MSRTWWRPSPGAYRMPRSTVNGTFVAAGDGALGDVAQRCVDDGACATGVLLEGDECAERRRAEHLRPASRAKR